MRTSLSLLLAAALLAGGCSDDAGGAADAGLDATTLPDSQPDSAARDRGPADAGPAVDTTATADAAPPPSYAAPKAYWAMDSADVSGAKLAAKIGGLEGKLVNTSVDAQGQVGQGQALDGSSAYIDFGDVLDSTFAGANKRFSVAFWVKSAAGNAGKAVILLAKEGDSGCTPAEDQRQWLTSLAKVGLAGFTYHKKLVGHVKLVMSKNTLGAGSWHHLIFVYDGSVTTAAGDRVTIYIDGAKEQTTPAGTGDFPFDLEDSAAHLSFGVRVSSQGNPCTASGAGFFAGSVDELAIWDVALSDAEALELYTRGKNKQPVI
jgi:hypothetical protein